MSITIDSGGIRSNSPIEMEVNNTLVANLSETEANFLATLRENGVGMLGIGQVWQDVTSIRTAGVSYINTSGSPIGLVTYTTNTTSNATEIFVDGVSISTNVYNSAVVGNSLGFAIIPAGSSYTILVAGTLFVRELRSLI